MDSTTAFMMGEVARRRGNSMRVFDWDKAATILKERNPESAIAGLASDMEYTSGIIWDDHKPNMDNYTYLASCWATPVLEIDGEEIECWKMMDGSGWDSKTKWPDSAIAIIHS